MAKPCQGTGTVTFHSATVIYVTGGQIQMRMATKLIAERSYFTAFAFFNQGAAIFEPHQKPGTLLVRLEARHTLCFSNLND